MTTTAMLRGFVRARRLSTASRAAVLAVQERRLRETLAWTFRHSLFYRNLWTKEGVRLGDLVHVPLAHLPVVTKSQLMGAFEEVVTDPGIRRRDVESFLEHDPSGQSLYDRRYLTLHTSGSSGVTGILLFTPSFWYETLGMLVARLLPLSLPRLLTRRTRAAFIGETSGHHAGASLLYSSPSLLFKTLSVSVSAAPREIAEALQAFQPHLLLGYASGLASLAAGQERGLLRIAPEALVSSGEPLTPTLRENIQRVFGIRPIDFYSATEALGIGADLSTPGVLDLFDDHVLVECVDAENRPVKRGEPGRVLLTIFGNRIQPLVRYVLDDEMILKPETSDRPFTQAEQVMGRNLDRLTFTLPGGKTLDVHPMDLVGLFFPGLRRYQVAQTGPTSVVFKMVVDGSREKAQKAIDGLVRDFLDYNNVPAGGLSYAIEFVDDIPPNPKTGKTPIVVPLALT